MRPVQSWWRWRGWSGSKRRWVGKFAAGSISILSRTKTRKDWATTDFETQTRLSFSLRWLARPSSRPSMFGLLTYACLTWCVYECGKHPTRIVWWMSAGASACEDQEALNRRPSLSLFFSVSLWSRWSPLDWIERGPGLSESLRWAIRMPTSG